MNYQLYKVMLKTHHEFRENYVVAENPTMAYQAVKDYYDKKDIGFAEERELDSRHLISDARSVIYVIRLFVVERATEKEINEYYLSILERGK